MLKKLTALFLSVLLLTSTASAGLWPDWAAPAEDWAEQIGLSDTFLDHPGMTVTRGQAAQMLYEAEQVVPQSPPRFRSPISRKPLPML